MACYYYIKLSDGGELKIPAFSGLTKVNSTLRTLIQDHYDAGKDEALLRYLKYQLKVKSPREDLKKVLDNSNSSSFIDNLNKYLIENLPEPDNDSLSDLLWRNIMQGIDEYVYVDMDAKESLINLQEVITKISAPVGDNYLQNISSIGLLNTFSPEQKLQKLDETLKDLYSSGVISRLDNVLYNILSSVFPENTEKILYNLSFSGEANDSIVTIPEGSNSPMIFYKDDNNISLFLGLIKYLGLNVQKKDIENILLKDKIDITKDWTLNDFFIGSFNEAGVYTKELFTEMLKYKPTLEKIVREIFVKNQVKYGWSTTQLNDLIDGALLFTTYLNSEKYEKSAYFEEDQMSILYNKEKEEYSTIILEQIQNQLTGKTTYGNNDFYYGSPVSKIFSKNEDSNYIVSAYNYIVNNLSMNRDLIKFPKLGEFGKYIVISSAEINNRGLKVEGYTESNGTFKAVYDYFKGDSIEITHRPLENLSTYKNSGPAQVIKNEDSIIIKASEGSFIDSSFAKEVLVRGAFVEIMDPKTSKIYNHVVKAVHPGKFEVNSKNLGLVGYNNIVTIKTKKIDFMDASFTDVETGKFEIFRNFTKLDILKSFKYISPGDIIATIDANNQKRYNRVVKVVDNNIYYLIKHSDGNYLIKSIDSELVTEILKKKKEVNLETDIKVITFNDILERDKSISNTEFSYFNNIELAKNGDYVIWDGVYRIANKEAGILEEVVFDEIKYKETNIYTKVPKEDFVKLNKFVTTRDISSSYARRVIDINSWDILTSKPKEGIFEEIVYLVKKNQDVRDLILLKSGALNKGYKGSKSHYYNEDGTRSSLYPKDYVDITEVIKKRISQERGVDVEGLYVKSFNKFYARYNKSLYAIREIGEFTDAQKEELLQHNSYITLKNNKGQHESKTYRIANIDKDFVTLEYSTFSVSGKILTILKTVPKKEVLEKIGILYLLKGNNKIAVVKKYQNALKISEEKQDKKQLLASMAQKFSSIFNIPVDITTEYKDKPDKKAWVETTETGNKIVINLNNNSASNADLIHEYLHLFLFALKYSSDGAVKYDSLLQEFRNNENIETNDPNELEEIFVKRVSNFMAGNEDIPMVDFGSFLSSFNSSLDNLRIKRMYLGSNIFEILNNDMSKVFGKTTNEGLMHAGLILFEANFREWLTDQMENNKNFEINCGNG